MAGVLSHLLVASVTSAPAGDISGIQRRFGVYLYMKLYGTVIFRGGSFGVRDV